MRSLIGIGLALLLIVSSSPDATAIGVQVAGEGECRCSPLTAAGIVPDPLNNLKEASGWRFAAALIDKIALEIRGVMSQLGAGRDRFARVEVDVPDSSVQKKATLKSPKAKKKPKISIPPRAK
jgi:hypothetical protein